MRSKLFEEKAKTAKINEERWVRILPDKGEGYQLYDAMEERPIGRILVDSNDHWIYDGSVLNVCEQEDVAGFITGYQKEMDDLISSIGKV